MSTVDELRSLADSLGAASVRRRLDEPIRVAIVGRVSAGKSTLLNALVGDRLAATDATETTRLPTWYRSGAGYRVVAIGPGEVETEVAHRRKEGRLFVEGEIPERASRLEVFWPSAALERMTLIDTPGLDGEAGASDVEADALIVVMRYRHAADAAFLEAFTRSRAGVPTAASAIAVVSRADEVGGGGEDSMEIAAQAAGRVADDSRIGPLCGTVLPVAGLLGEAGAVLTEAHVEVLRTVAGLDDADRRRALSSADRFRSAPTSKSTAIQRHAVLVRLGVAGVRIAVGALAEGRAIGAADLGPMLRSISGVPALSDELHRRFGERSEALRALSAITELRRISKGDVDVERELERIEAESDELVALALGGLLAEGIPGLTDEDAASLKRLAGAGDPTTRLGVDEPGVAGAAAIAAAKWRAAESDPIADREFVEAARLAARLAEGIHAEATRS